MPRCNKCGKQNIDTAKFCTGCGAAIAIKKESDLHTSGFEKIVFTTTPADSLQPKARRNPIIAWLLSGILLFGVATATYFIFFSKKKKPGSFLNADSNKINGLEQKVVPDTIMPKQEMTVPNDEWSANHSLTSATYTGTIGTKKFTLHLEYVLGNNVKGYNITGNNKRPVEGTFTESHGQYDQFGDKTVVITTNIYHLKLREPGKDEWDGIFDLKIELCDWFNEGSGTWKSYNGKLTRSIAFKDMELEKLLSDQ